MTYNITIQQRKTRAQFTASNDVIPASTLCIETDTGTYTVGDGPARYMAIRGNQQLNSDELRSADDVWAMLGAQSSGASNPAYKALLYQDTGSVSENFVFDDSAGPVTLTSPSTGSIVIDEGWTYGSAQAHATTSDPSISVSVGYPGDGTIQVYSPADGYAVTLSIEVFE